MPEVRAIGGGVSVAVKDWNIQGKPQSGGHEGSGPKAKPGNYRRLHLLSFKSWRLPLHEMIWFYKTSPGKPHFQNFMFLLSIIMEAHLAIPSVAPTAAGIPTPILILSEIDKPSSLFDVFDPPLWLDKGKMAELTEEELVKLVDSDENCLGVEGAVDETEAAPLVFGNMAGQIGVGNVAGQIVHITRAARPGGKVEHWGYEFKLATEAFVPWYEYWNSNVPINNVATEWGAFAAHAIRKTTTHRVARNEKTWTCMYGLAGVKELQRCFEYRGSWNRRGSRSKSHVKEAEKSLTNIWWQKVSPAIMQKGIRDFNVMQARILSPSPAPSEISLGDPQASGSGGGFEAI
ncbi:hypothetical protein BKA70DRAFT_1215020 [Coprinopsis sp. MPI-PUGE-AT-0042]|nr:hypothetical protein BKA70DRAFT_1215020 [Coprinopsis sp. MPI-PUGE-AT-0042]